MYACAKSISCLIYITCDNEKLDEILLSTLSSSPFPTYEDEFRLRRYNVSKMTINGGRWGRDRCGSSWFTMPRP